LLRGDISFRYLKQFFLVIYQLCLKIEIWFTSDHRYNRVCIGTETLFKMWNFVEKLDSGIVITRSVWYEAGTTCTSIRRSERVNNNIGPNNNTKVSFLDGLPDIWSDTYWINSLNRLRICLSCPCVLRMGTAQFWNTAVPPPPPPRHPAENN
jgi:hypothetical protein